MHFQWNENLAYAIGLLTSDGCLSKDGRHIEFTSKDKIQVINFKKCLNLSNRISKKAREKGCAKKYHHIQFGNVMLYKFLLGIGLKSAKSLTLEKVSIPRNFFPDFLRGLFDGDGSFSSNVHPESKHLQAKLRFSSASPKFIRWLHKEINKNINLERGYIVKDLRAESLSFGKEDAKRIVDFMYYSSNVICLPRKLDKIKKIFADVAESA